MFDFDQWMALARDEPAAFERRKRAAIDAYLAEVPGKRRAALQRLQWRIDMEVRRSRSPLGGCVRIYRMMLDCLEKQRTAIESLLTGASVPRPQKQARIVKLTRHPPDQS